MLGLQEVGQKNTKIIVCLPINIMVEVVLCTSYSPQNPLHGHQKRKTKTQQSQSFKSVMVQQGPAFLLAMFCKNQRVRLNV